MVHVKNCPLGTGGRGRTCTQFYIDGKSQKYCYGVVDLMTDEPLAVCKNCKDYYAGEQCEQDFQEFLKRD